jgi:hypothetical protein
MIFGTIGSCGCMHTELGGNPEPSPDNRYAIATRAYGASGKPYSAQTKKRFRVWIGPKTSSNPARAFKKTYLLMAGDMAWKVNWHGPDEVAVDLYDEGRGTGFVRTEASSPASNHVASLLFRKALDGGFTEVR